MRETQDRVVVIGAGMGGLAAAIRLSAAGRRVLVLDRHAAPGGRARQIPSEAGPVDAGPTVLTMRWVFDDLFAAAGASLDDYVTLFPQKTLARHWWPDGSQLDLFADEARSAAAVRDFAGPRAEAQFAAFSRRAADLFEAFDAPLMRAPQPSIAALTGHVLRHPHLISKMAPLSSLARSLARSFDDPRLQQLFGRYATYVGGSPYQSPAVLALIWHAEASGVNVVQGGMHALARAMADLAMARGAEFRFDTHVQAIETTASGVSSVVTDSETVQAQSVVFNGDPRALATGALGPDVSKIAPQTRKAPRSLSANVWAFAARPGGARARDLGHHNVFFCADPAREFADLRDGHMPEDPTLYVCAEDRGTSAAPPERERFEIIMNAPPLAEGCAHHAAEEVQACLTRTFPILRRHGLSFDPIPEPETALTRPSGFHDLFPRTRGALYGQSPHGMTAAFQRPQALTAIPGLVLCGGGTHPGAGVPMSALSGAHAAAAILTGRTLRSPSRPMAMPGGISTPSRRTARAPSR